MVRESRIGNIAGHARVVHHYPTEEGVRSQRTRTDTGGRCLDGNGIGQRGRLRWGSEDSTVKSDRGEWSGRERLSKVDK
jgi:hypothetical protein